MTAEALGRTLVAHGVHVLDGVRDPDEVSEIAARTTRPHTLLPRAAGTTLDVQLHTIVSDGDIQFNRLFYGGEVTVVPGDYEPDSFLLPVSIHGSGALRYGRARVPISSADTTLIPLYREFQSDIGATYDQVLVSIERTRFEAVAAALQGHDDARAFDPPLTRFTLSEPVLRLLETAAWRQRVRGRCRIRGCSGSCTTSSSRASC